jgi:hypothetical protein
MRLVPARSVVTCLMVLAAGVLAAGCDWGQFGFTGAHTGDNSGESAITTGNASTLTKQFSVSLGTDLSESQVATSGGIAYVLADDGNLYAFSATGATGCSGTPKACTPLWSASVGTAGPSNTSGPAVSQGMVYVMGESGNLYAFDAAGKTNCSGTPTVCSPLWQGEADGPFTSPTVANGVVYVGSATNGGTVEAFDQFGRTNCAGTPTVCAPLWASTSLGTFPFGAISVTNNLVYAVGTSIYVFDAAGKTGCAGTPTVCSPLWQYTPNEPVSGSAVITGSTLYVDTSGPLINPPKPTGALEAFDANGVTNCAGTPKVCNPLWTSGNEPSFYAPTVANGFTFVPTFTGALLAYDANGSTGCSGSPKVCTPVWKTSVADGSWRSSAVVGGNVLYIVDGNSTDAFDANGAAGCSTAVCSPLWTSGNAIGAEQVSVANGVVYVTAETSASIGGVLAYGP